MISTNTQRIDQQHDNTSVCEQRNYSIAMMKTLIAVGVALVALGITFASIPELSNIAAEALIGSGTPLLSLGVVASILQLQVGSDSKHLMTALAISGLILGGGIALASISYGVPALAGNVMIAVGSAAFATTLLSWTKARIREGQEAVNNYSIPTIEDNRTDEPPHADAQRLALEPPGNDPDTPYPATTRMRAFYRQAKNFIGEAHYRRLLGAPQHHHNNADFNQTIMSQPDPHPLYLKYNREFLYAWKKGDDLYLYVFHSRVYMEGLYKNYIEDSCAIEPADYQSAYLEETESI